VAVGTDMAKKTLFFPCWQIFSLDSDPRESATEEIGLFFSPDEIFSYKQDINF
jgi:hypothetical protein